MELIHSPFHQVVVVGGGAGGLAAAASLLRRRPSLDIAVIEPRDTHYYQPGWTLVGGGVFKREQTVRPMAEVMPQAVSPGSGRQLQVSRQMTMRFTSPTAGPYATIC